MKDSDGSRERSTSRSSRRRPSARATSRGWPRFTTRSRPPAARGRRLPATSSRRSGFARAAQFFMQYIPLPNGPNNTWVSNPVVEFNQDQFTLRGDHSLAARHKLFLRFSRHSNHEDRPSTFPALGATELWGPAFNLAGALTSNFGTSVVHELRISRMYGEYRSTAYFQGQGTDLLAQAGVTGMEQAQDPAIASLPAFSFSGYAGFSGNAGDGRPKWQDRGEWEITDNVTWVKGRHILKFGGRVYRRNILFTDARDHNGTYGFTGVMTQNPASAAGTGDGFRRFPARYPGEFHAIEPGHLVGRIRHLPARLLPGRLQGRELTDPEPGVPLRVHALVDRLQGPGGRVRPDARKVDHRLEQDQ